MLTEAAQREVQSMNSPGLRTGAAVYLHAPEASELLSCGEVGAAHRLPQLVRVRHVVVDVIHNRHQTCRHTHTHTHTHTHSNRQD